tara:strand:+ start:16 stop:285 length:270 start_codon:yes stop_codon:yes gene_type:complete
MDNESETKVVPSPPTTPKKTNKENTVAVCPGAPKRKSKKAKKKHKFRSYRSIMKELTSAKKVGPEPEKDSVNSSKVKYETAHFKKLDKI